MPLFDGTDRNWNTKADLFEIQTPIFWPAFNSLPSLQLANSFSKMASSHFASVFFLRLQQSWLTWWNCFVAARNGVWWTGKRFFFFFRVTDAAGCSLCWNESTHYVRAIAVFKISLTLRVIHLPCFWTDRDGGEAKRKEGKDWLEVIYKHCALWLPFPRLKHKTRLVPRCVLFFFFVFISRLHLVWGFFFLTCAHSQSRPAHPPFSLSLSEAHTKHTHTHPVHAYTHPGSPWLLNCHCSEITA